MNFQTNHTSDTSISAVINRAVTAAFSFAIIGAVGVMTFAQFVELA